MRVSLLYWYRPLQVLPLAQPPSTHSAQLLLLWGTGLDALAGAPPFLFSFDRRSPY